jgi:hypothetical protein
MAADFVGVRPYCQDYFARRLRGWYKLTECSVKLSVCFVSGPSPGLVTMTLVQVGGAVPATLHPLSTGRRPAPYSNASVAMLATCSDRVLAGPTAPVPGPAQTQSSHKTAHTITRNRGPRRVARCGFGF